METEVAERILSCGSNLVLEKEGYVPLQVLDEDDYSLSHQDNGVCHFYQNDLCELHRSHGLSHKPVVCQLYPYTLVSTPGGIFVSLLFSCPAVVSGTGADPIEQRKELAQLFKSQKGNIPQLHAPSSHIQVSSQTSITWLEYMELEPKLLKLVERTDPVASLLKMVKLFLPDISYSELSSQLVQIAKGFGGYLSLDDYEMTKFRLSKPSTTIEGECIRRFLVHQIRGKLLIIGPTVICQLLIYALGMAITLDVLDQKKKRNQVLDFSFQYLHEAFVLLEGQLLTPRGDYEQVFLDWEKRLQGAGSLSR